MYGKAVRTKPEASNIRAAQEAYEVPPPPPHRILPGQT